MLATETLFDAVLVAAAQTVTEARRLYDAGAISDDTLTLALDVYAVTRRSVPGGYVVPVEARVSAPPPCFGVDLAEPGPAIDYAARLREFFRAAKPAPLPPPAPAPLERATSTDVVTIEELRRLRAEKKGSR